MDGGHVRSGTTSLAVPDQFLQTDDLGRGHPGPFCRHEGVPEYNQADTHSHSHSHSSSECMLGCAAFLGFAIRTIECGFARLYCNYVIIRVRVRVALACVCAWCDHLFVPHRINLRTEALTFTSGNCRGNSTASMITRLNIAKGTS